MNDDFETTINGDINTNILFKTNYSEDEIFEKGHDNTLDIDNNFSEYELDFSPSCKFFCEIILRFF